MAIGTITGGERLKFAGTFQSSESLTQSTATTPQSLSVTTDISVLGMGTATGAAVLNLYTLGAGVEGQEKWIYSNATGEASVVFRQISGRLDFGVSAVYNSTATTADGTWASATGQVVFQAANEYIGMKYLNDAWHVLVARGVTQATTT